MCNVKDDERTAAQYIPQDWQSDLSSHCFSYEFQLLVLKLAATKQDGSCQFIDLSIALLMVNDRILVLHTHTSTSCVRSYWRELSLNCAIWLGPSLRVTYTKQMNIINKLSMKQSLFNYPCLGIRVAIWFFLSSCKYLISYCEATSPSGQLSQFFIFWIIYW